MEALKERLKNLRKNTLHMTQQEFSDRLKISRSNIAGYEVGKSEPADSVISLICREFNVNEEWLRNGTGEMFVRMSRDEEIASFVGSILKDEEATFKKKFIKMLASLSEDEWEFLELKARELVDGNE